MSALAQPNAISKCIFKHCGLSPRGGSTLVIANDMIIGFGGANREQEYFNDLWILKKDVQTSVTEWEKIEASGDVPPPRSGHACCTYGNYILLFGGVDFENEAIYNDLYIMSTDTWEWKYVGESGEEISARNSHSLGIVASNGVSYLVVFGGASPELGPLGETFYASLPPPEDITLTENDSFFVTWNKLDSSPGIRELHSTAFYNNSMIISGGRNFDSVLMDIWILTSSENGDVPIKWKSITNTSLQLNIPRCAHTAVVLRDRMYIFGGFTGEGISGDMCCVDLPILFSDTADIHDVVSTSASSIQPDRTLWNNIALAIEIPSRFGHSMCNAPSWINSTQNGGTTVPIPDGEPLLIFGGIDAHLDYNDLWAVWPLN